MIKEEIKKSYQIKFNQKRLHQDLIVRLSSLNLNQRQIKPISRSTLSRMATGKPITMQVFLKCVEWLDNEPERYIYYVQKA